MKSVMWIVEDYEAKCDSSKINDEKKQEVISNHRLRGPKTMLLLKSRPRSPHKRWHIINLSHENKRHGGTWSEGEGWEFQEYILNSLLGPCDRKVTDKAVNRSRCTDNEEG